MIASQKSPQQSRNIFSFGCAAGLRRVGCNGVRNTKRSIEFDEGPIDLRTAQLASEMGITNHFCKNKAPTAHSLGIAPLGVRLGGSSATANSPPALTSS